MDRHKPATFVDASALRRGELRLPPPDAAAAQPSLP